MTESGLARPWVLRVGRMLAALLTGSVLTLASYAGTTNYEYDALGRLVTVTTPANGTDQSQTAYSYDAAGNRVSVNTTFTDLTAPNPPTALTATPQASDRIRLNWTTSLDVGGGPVSYYKVYRGGVNVASPTAPPYDDQPLSANTTYSYTVSAVDPAGHESTSNPTASATTPPPPDLTPPSVPANLQGAAVSGTWINLTWNASTDTGGSGLAGYEIFRDGSGTPLNTSTVASYADQTLTPATTHTYQVRAYDGAGNRSALSNQVSVTTLDTIAPGAPGTPTMSAITVTTATATWTAATDNVGVTGYRYSLNGGSSWTTLGNVLTTNLTGLTPATGYTIQVQARDAAANWGASASKSFTTATDTTAPSAPGVPTMSAITINSATATWTAATDNVGVTGYRYSLNGGSSWTTLGNVLTTNLTGLTPATGYTIQVQARDAAAHWGPSASKSFTTSSDATPPGAPGNPTMSAITATTATATWTAATDNVGVTGYRYSLNGGTSWTTLGNVLTTNLTGLTPATGYTIQVQARDAASNWGASGSKAFTTLADTTAPSAPGNLTFTSITGTTATATWTAATDNVAVTGYRYSLNGGSSWTTLGNVLTTNLTGLTSSTSYTMQVQARDAAGNWGGSGSGSFTTSDATPPSAPGNPTFSSITASSATATWTAATDNVGVTGYRYSLNGGSSWTTLGNVLTTSLTGLSSGVQYTLLVQARDAAGNWGASGSGSFTTVDTVAPSAPGNPTFSSVTGTSATASWSAATDNLAVTGYRYSLNGGSSWTTLGNVLSTGLTGLAPATGYTLLVQARDAAGNWGASGSGSFTTVDTVAPSTPGNPTFTLITGTTATASWSAASDNVGVTGYRYSLNGGSSWIAVGNVLSTNLSGLSPATSYTVLVQAGDAGNNWGPSGSGSFTTVDTVAPSAPGNPTFSSITPTSATAAWTAATDNVAVTGYRYSLNGGASWVNVGATLSVNLTGLARGTGYTMLVQAGDAAGNWGASGSGSFTTLTNYTDNFTLTSGNNGADGMNYPIEDGYQSASFGSISPTTTTDGKTIVAYYSAYQLFFDGANWTATTWTVLGVSGFSSNPGQGWLQSITGAGTGASATSFGCNSSTCLWQWPTYTPPNGAITLVHQ